MKTDRTNAQRQARWRAKQAEKLQQEKAALMAAKGIPGPPALSTVPGERRWAALIEQARAALETVREEMQAYYDDRSEQWQDGDRAAQFQDRMDALDSILADLDAVSPV